MEEAHIYIYGDIFNEQSDYASEWGVVSLTSVLKDVQAAKDAEKLIVHIHSRGGDVREGFAIHDYLVNTGKEIETIVEGMCFSIATVIFCAGTVRQMTENSEFMIHSPFGGAFGDAEEIQKYADYLKEVEDKLIDFYAEVTGANRNKIKGLVTEEVFMDVDEAIKLGFATEKIDTIKAVAFLGNPNIKINQMNKDKQKEAMNILEKIRNIISPKGADEPKNLALEAVDGTKLVFDTEESLPQEGDRVTADGNNITDEVNYELPSGESVTAKDGVVTSVTPPSDDTPPQDKEKITQMQAKIDEQESTIGVLKGKIEASDKSQKDILAEMDKLKGLMGSDFQPPGDNDRAQNRISDKPEAELSPVASAIKRRKEAAGAGKE